MICVSSFAEEAEKPALKWYGFVRTYFAFDTRESSAGTEDLYFYMPKDRSMVDGVDMNLVPSFRYAALTSRLGLDLVGVEALGYKLGGKIEADFYAGVSGVTGTAQFRLRQAYATIAKNDRFWKIGQAWHPMAADLPDIFSLESGAPFGPFSRTPQVNFEWKIAGPWSLTAAAIWQMQYTSTGPKITKQDDGNYKYVATASADYIKYSCTPEFYLGFNCKGETGLFRVGFDLLSIKPRNYDYDINTGKALKKVSDRLTTWNVFVYGQQRFGEWDAKLKVTFANDGSHFNLVGGYGVSGINESGSWNYLPTRTLAGWMTFCRKQKGCNWVPQILLGYSRIFGTADDLIDASLIGGTAFWGKNNAGSANRLFRVQPEILYNLGKLQFGLEYMLTGVQYGKANAAKQPVTDLHWIFNNRIQGLVKFNF